MWHFCKHFPFVCVKLGVKDQGQAKMKNLFLGVALFVLMVAVCEAHLCLFNPQQRGTMNGINAAGKWSSTYAKVTSLHSLQELMTAYC